ncbi:hypothetical protein BDZ91DRAFT_553062 [Kalaharituber pfeilii]|nr:hypothetical protein BDZ91DRAFT_553062 [Kalaharituber pfeilii]
MADSMHRTSSAGDVVARQPHHSTGQRHLSCSCWHRMKDAASFVAAKGHRYSVPQAETVPKYSHWASARSCGIAAPWSASAPYTACCPAMALPTVSAASHGRDPPPAHDQMPWIDRPAVGKQGNVPSRGWTHSAPHRAVRIAGLPIASGLAHGLGHTFRLTLITLNWTPSPPLPPARRCRLRIYLRPGPLLRATAIRPPTLSVRRCSKSSVQRTRCRSLPSALSQYLVDRRCSITLPKVPSIKLIILTAYSPFLRHFLPIPQLVPVC